MKIERRYDLDWLRIIAFTVLIFFHGAIFFIPGGLPIIQNAETSPTLDAFVALSSQFRLALLFFISGVGIGFARRVRNPGEFIRERSLRLLIPLTVGLAVIVPPMVYIEKLHIGEVSGDFLSFYRGFFSSGVYPQGNLSWHHLWFIAYLYLYCLLGLKAFDRLSALPPQARIIAWGNDARVYAFILPLLAAELPLRLFFPGFPDLIHDWANFFHWFLILLAGFHVAHRPGILDNAERLRVRSLILAVLSAAMLFTLFYRNGRIYLSPEEPYVVPLYIALCVIRMTLVWTCILSCLGFASRYLRKPGRLLGYLNESVYPLFILHLTVMTAISYYVVDWDANLWLKYFAVTALTVVTILFLYHFAIRPFNIPRVMFGMRPRG